MAAAIAIAFTAIPSIASTFSSASLSNFTFTLVDLDLNDGIIPKITFGSNTKSYLGVSSDSSDPTKVLSIEGDNISPTMLTITRADYTASASVSGDNFDNKVLQVSGNSLGEIMSGIQYIYSGQVTDIVPFILSGKTQLTLLLMRELM